METEGVSAARYSPGLSGLRVRRVADAFEQGRGQVTLARVREHCKNDRALGRLLRTLERSREGAARGNTAEYAFLRRQRARSLDGFVVCDRDQIVRQRAVQHRGDEIRRPALDLVRLPLRAAEQRGADGLGDDDTGVGPRLLDDLAGAGQRAARAPAGHPEVQTPAGEVAQDLRAGGGAVVV